MLTFRATERGYHNLWSKALVDPAKQRLLDAICDKIEVGKVRYLRVEKEGGVPWFLVAALHYRESDLDFRAYLGNGQPLSERTTEVPAGAGPFASFEEGAADALNREHFWQASWEWSIERCLWAAEEFNGEGYAHLNVNSPYVWDWTDLYGGGLFVADHQFSSTKRENRAGVAAIIRALAARDADVAARVGGETSSQQPQTPPQKQEPTMSDISGEIASAEKIAITVLPFVATVFPPIAPFVPIIQTLLALGADINSAGGDPNRIASAIAAHLTTLGTHAASLPKLG